MPLSIIILLLVTTASLMAQTDSTKWNQKLSLLMSPLELVTPIVRVQSEFRVANTHGMALQLGVGEQNSQFGFAIGAQYAWYMIGDFEHGMQLGAIVQYANSSESLTFSRKSGRGVAIGPILGYKYIAPFGLTVALTSGPLLLRYQNETQIQPNLRIKN